MLVAFLDPDQIIGNTLTKFHAVSQHAVFFME